MFVLPLLVSQLSLTHALRFHLRHNARAQQLFDSTVAVEKIRRQDVPIANGAAFGIDTIDVSLRNVVVATTAPGGTTSVQPSTLVPLTTRLSIPVPVPTPASATSVTAVVPTATISDTGIPTYVFPSSTVQVPVATICQHNNTTAATPTTVSVNTSSSPSAIPFPPISGLFNSTSSNITAPSEHNAQARIVEHDAEVARLVFGSGTDTCQTLYTPKTTAVCRTSVRVPGALPVTVSRCDQWITFSTAAPTGACGSLSTLSTGAGAATGTAVGIPATATAVPSFAGQVDADVVIPSLSVTTALPVPRAQDTLYYVANWWDLASHDVPRIVRIEDCVGKETGDTCVVRTESWRVTESLSTNVGTGVVTYSGPIILTSGTNTLSTSVSFSSLVTTTQTVRVPTIVRSILGSSSVTPTVTVPVTMPTVKTYSLESLTTLTVTSHVTITRTVAAFTSTLA